MDKRALLLEQLNDKMAFFIKSKSITGPGVGWVKAIRLALGMSLQQLGNKLNITPQGVKDMEKREMEGSISMKSLQEIARALDMQFVYGFVPNDGTLEKLIDRRANELATQIVMRTSNTMKLEDQENSEKRIKKAIKERAEKIKNETPKILWD